MTYKKHSIDYCFICDGNTRHDKGVCFICGYIEPIFESLEDDIDYDLQDAVEAIKDLVSWCDNYKHQKYVLKVQSELDLRSSLFNDINY